MNVVKLSSQELRSINLIRIARTSILTGLALSVLYFYWGISTQTWYNFLIAGSFLVVSIIAFLIAIDSKNDNQGIGAWLLLSSILLSALLISIFQSNAGTEVSSAVLIIILVIVVQTFPPKIALRGAILGAIASLVCGILAFYSPLQLIPNANADSVTTWIARISTLTFLAMVMRQFRNLSLTNKLLISFLGVVVLISLIFNIVMTTTTTNLLTDEIGQQLHSAADGRSIIIGDYLNAQVEVLKTLALDETIRQSVRAANALEPKLEDVLLLDERWQKAVAAGTEDSLINSRLSNSLANDLYAFQLISPDHIEVFVTDKMGAIVAATGKTTDYYQADEEWWQYAFNQKDTYISSPVVDQSANTLSIQIAVPIFDTRQGDLIGILRTTLSIRSLIALIDDPIGKTGKISINFPNRTMLDTYLADYKLISPENLVAIRNSTGRTYLRASFEGKDRILAHTDVRARSSSSKVNELGWSIIVSQETNEALAPIQEQVRLSGFFGTIMAGIAALLSLLLAQRLANPIVGLTQTADEISQGNLEARVEVNSQDEIGQLGESFNAMTARLRETLLGLEARVAERTAELEKSSQQLDRRAKQFEAIAQLARTITSIQNIETLLSQTTRLVSQFFGFYHVGLFLLDESREYAVLSAANSDGGQKMLARRHRLAVGKTGIVGYVTATGLPRIALDTGVDAVYFDNPDLPETRSEISLPLKVGGLTIGALDVQSTEANAFSEDDIEVLTILADEISVAIENTRLFEESQRALADANSAVGDYTLGAWQNIIKRNRVAGYELSGATIHTLNNPVSHEESTANLPIKLRDRIVGKVNIRMPNQEKLTPDQQDIVQALVQRVNLAIENATYIEESQRTAAKEQVISEITGKIGSSINLRNVLQTAVEELGRNIPGSEIVIELKNQFDQLQGSFSENTDDKVHH